MSRGSDGAVCVGEPYNDGGSSCRPAGQGGKRRLCGCATRDKQPFFGRLSAQICLSSSESAIKMGGHRGDAAIKALTPSKYLVFQQHSRPLHRHIRAAEVIRPLR